MSFTVFWYFIVFCIIAGLILAYVGAVKFKDPFKSKNWFFLSSVLFLLPVVWALIFVTIDQFSLSDDTPSKVPVGFIFFALIVISALFLACFWVPEYRVARNATIGCSAFLFVVLVIFLVFFTMMMALMEPPIPGKQYGDFKYVEESGQITITRYWAEDKTVEIPSAINGINVTRIGGEAFSSNDFMTAVVIPDSITIIDSLAFYRCESLTDVTIPNSVTIIGGSAFSGCAKLTSITIPESVTEIGEEAFEGCEKLVIHCSEDSYAHNYAVDQQIEFVLVE